MAQPALQPTDNERESTHANKDLAQQLSDAKEWQRQQTGPVDPVLKKIENTETEVDTRAESANDSGE